MKTYKQGKDCEFRADGKLRGGKIIDETDNSYRIVYHCPNHREIELAKDKVKVWNKKLNCYV